MMTSTDKKWITTLGYVTVFVNGKFIYEHRVIIEKALGRKLTKNEIVHHKDGNPGNNDFSNLEVMTRSEHGKHHKTRQPYGIYWSKNHGKWVLRVWKGEIFSSFGLYESKEDALKAFESGIKIDRRGMNNVGKTHCKNGHEFSVENTYIFRSIGKTVKKDMRRCRICRDEYTKNYREGRKTRNG